MNTLGKLVTMLLENLESTYQIEIDTGHGTWSPR